MADKIKIVFIISDLGIGGAQIFLHDLIKNLINYNCFQISVITLNSGGYIKNIENTGIKVYDLKQPELICLRIFPKLKQLLMEIKPDIVHTHLNKADFYGRIVAKRLDVPVIISTCHNYSTSHNRADIRKIYLLDRVDNFVVAYSGCFLFAVSNIVKEYLIKRNKSHERITEVIYNGTDITRTKYRLNEKEIMELRNVYDVSIDDFVVSVIGRLDKQKGHLFFLESIKEILNNNQGIKVMIVGEGSLSGQIESYIRENDLRKQVIMTGFEKDCEAYMEISDLICVPSLWEAFGLVIIEGMIKKKIILASNVGGITEIVKDGYNGFLFESLNRESFVAKINFIYNHCKEMNSLKENALNTVREKFDVMKSSELYYQAYLKYLNIRHLG